MQITKTLYAKDRKTWRAWLAKNHAKEKEIWLIYYKKQSGKARIPYADAVEEALCFGWIDSTAKGIDAEKYAQRFSPRRKGSNWSEPNKERIKRLIKLGKMAPAGLAALKKDIPKETAEIGEDIINALKKQNKVWQNFQKFPKTYRKIRLAWIEGARKRPKEFIKRLDYLVKMTAKNKKFGMKI